LRTIWGKFHGAHHHDRSRRRAASQQTRAR
jgi:hypothetical protein